MIFVRKLPIPHYAGKLLFSVFFSVVLIASSCPEIYAAILTEAQKTVYRNGIGPFDVAENCGLTSDAVSLSGTLPAETIKKLDNANIKAKLEKMKDIYLHAQQQTNVPWLVLAAIHYREADMQPGKSISNGQPLGNYKNVDGLMISADAKTDAVLAAKHLLEFGNSIIASQTIETLGQAFLSYNRGYMYQNWNKTWKDSPYVMNGYDSSHMNMKWIDADSYVKPGGRRVNSVSGSVDSRPGALAVYKYLSDDSVVQASAYTTDTGECVSSDVTGGSATIVGDVAFPLIATKAHIDKHNKGLFRNGTTGQAGHNYIAYDIMTPPQTKVAAFMSGTVISTSTGNRCKRPGTTITIYNEENKLTITYIHVFKTGFIKPKDTVAAGQVIAAVGTKDYGCGTAHLHIDANVTKGRPSCSRLSCSRASKSAFRDIGAQLYKTYMALPGSEGVSSL